MPCLLECHHPEVNVSVFFVSKIVDNSEQKIVNNKVLKIILENV